MPPPETHFVDGDLLWCGLYNRDLEFTAVYTELGTTYIKRFKIGGVIMNSDYRYIPENAEWLFCCIGVPDKLYVKYKPAKGQRISQQVYKPKQVLVKSVKAKGIQMSSKEIAKIDIKPGRWWDKKAKSPPGMLV